MSILSRLQSQVTGREIDISPTGRTARIARQGREAIQGSVSNAFRAILPTAEESSSVQAVQTPILTGTDRQRQLESYAQLADDRRRSALETELYQLTQPGRVYNEETTARNRARVQEIEHELSMLPARDDYNPLMSVAGAVRKGLGMVAQGGADTFALAEDAVYTPFELVSGLKLGDLSDQGFFNQWADDIRRESESANQFFQENMERGGKPAELLETLGASAVAAIPQAGLALATAGGSAAAQTAGGLSRAAASQLSPGVAATVRNTVQGMSKNPQFWTSFSQVVGSGYEDAIADQRARGETDENLIRTKAALFAIGNGLLNSAVEVGGGIETLPAQLQSGGSAWRSWVDSMVDEGKEEVVQGVIERALQNPIYQQGNPLFSTTDPNAILNPATAAQEFAGGAVVGGLLGGGQIALQRLARDNHAQTRPRQTAAPTQTGQTETPSGVEAGTQTIEAAPILRPNQVLLPTEPGQVTVLPRGEMSGAQQNGALTQTQKIQAAANVQTENQTGRGLGTQIPVEERTWEDASNRQVNAFQYDHPELRPYYAEAAQALRNELASGTRGERFAIRDQDGYITGYTGTSRSQSSPIEQALDNANLSYADIDRALTAIINDQGQENYAAAKKMELVLDDMLSNGYTGADGHVYGPNDAYLSARESVNRGLPADSTDYRMSEEEWASLLAQDGLDLSSRSGQVYERSGDGASLSAPVGAEAPSENDVYDIYGSGRENLPETAVGANKASPWTEFVSSSTEFIPEGANAARDVDVPTKDPRGRLIRRTASTAMGAKAIPDEAVVDIQNMVLRGELSYTRKSDRAAIDRAMKTIQDKTYQGALEEFRSQVQKGVISKDVTALGQQLLINAANAGDGDTMAEVLTLYAQMETTAGQVVQAASILRKLSPSSQLYAAQRTVSDLEKAIQKRYKDIKLTIDPALLEEFNQQTDQEGRNVVLGKIYQNVADQIPSNWKDKWNAWRYLAMLANPRTHVRNVAGNFFFQPLRIVKDRVAAAIEAGVSAAGGGKLQRTKSFLISQELYRAAWGDWANVRDVLSGNKYDDIRSEINSRRRIFRFAPLEAARTGNSWLLEFEDSIFKRITYADALAGYLQANGVTAEQMRNNMVDAQVMSRARDYAAQEALRATYQDRNAVSNKVVEVARVLGPAGEAILPFKRTPANILVRGMEYSPAGLAKALTADLVQVRRGNMTGAEAIDHIASGLTGSALFAIGAYLFSQGIVTSGGGDDENEDRFNELTGSQNYALNLPDGTNVTLDWLAPEALPFFMGVELMDSMGQGGNTADSIMTALKSISDPMLELSMLQSLNDVIDSVSFSENKLGAMAASSVISYFTQAIPTIGGQIERSGEDVRMSTYTDKNLALPTDIQYAIGRASARIPGVDYQQIPYIDAWGREESSGPTLLRMGNNFLNPAYTSRTEVTPVDEEIRQLYNRTGDGGVVPDRPPRYITVDGERVDLTAEQYVQYATDRGQMQFRMLEDLFDRPEYNALSSTDRAALVNDVYEYADKVTKAEISDYELDGWVKTAAESGVDPEDYLIFRAMTANITGDKDENGDTISGSKKEKMLAAIDMMDLSVQEKDALYYALGYSESTLRSAPWH